jgi:hypothetical protein
LELLGPLARPLLGLAPGGEGCVELGLQAEGLLIGACLQLGNGLAGSGYLVGELLMPRPILFVLMFGCRELLAQLADFRLAVCQLQRRLLAGGTGLGLDGVELSAGHRQLLDEPLMLRAAFVKLLPQGRDFIVAIDEGPPLEARGGGLKFFGELPNPQAELAFDLRKSLAVLVERQIGALTQCAQLLRSDLGAIARNSRPRFRFFHENAGLVADSTE